MSFGRGKPVSALGGGALVWKETPAPHGILDQSELPNRWTALMRAGAYNAARFPMALRVLSAIPALGIGTTLYDPEFSRGPMPGSAVALAGALLPDLDAGNDLRTQRAEALAARLVAETDDPDKFRGSGRGELHLSVLIESFRREGYEL